MPYVVRDTKNFAGESGISIDISALGCTRTDYGWLFMPAENQGDDMGAVQIVRAANAITVYNYGDAVTSFVIIAFTLISAPDIQGGLFNILEYGTKNFNGDAGVSIDISGLGDATYINPFIGIMPTEDNDGDVGEIYYTLAANAITVYNKGDSRDEFAYMIGKHA
jgi:hypothetical protein